MKKFDLKKAILENKATFYSSLNEAEGLTPLQDYVYQYEIEISGEDRAQDFLDDIKQLQTPQDVYDYYAYGRELQDYDVDNIFRQVKRKFANLASADDLTSLQRRAYNYTKERFGNEEAKNSLDQIKTLTTGQEFTDWVNQKLKNLGEGYDEFKRADKGSKDVTAKDKGEEEVYGAGVKKGEEIEKKKLKENTKMKKSDLKAKIKEMIVAEMDGPAVEDAQYDFLAELEEMLNESPINDPRTAQIIQMLRDMEVDGETMEYILRQVGMDDQMANQLVNYPAEYAASLKEADETEKDTAEVDTTDVAVDDTETVTTSTEVEVDPNVKAVQDALTQAQVAAQKLGDKKLTDQIGNTITFFTREHVVEKPKTAVAEGELKEFQKPEEDSNIEVLKKRYQFVPLEDLKTLASKQDFKVWTIGSPDFDANAVQLGDYIKFPMDSEPALVFQADEQSVNAAYDNAEYSKYNRSLLKKMNREASTGIKENQSISPKLLDFVDGDDRKTLSTYKMLGFEVEVDDEVNNVYFAEMDFKGYDWMAVLAVLEDCQREGVKPNMIWNDKNYSFDEAMELADNKAASDIMDDDGVGTKLEAKSMKKSVNESMFPMLKKILK